MGILHLTEKKRMTKKILIIIGMIFLLAFAYFSRIDGYRGRIEQFSSYKTLVAQKEFFDVYIKL